MGETTPPNSTAPSPTQRIIQLVGLGVLVLVVVWAARNLDGRAVMRAVRASDWRLLVAAAGVNLGVMALQSWRWRILLESLAPVPYASVVGAFIMSLATSSVVPARAGEVVRVHLIARRMRVKRAAVAGTTLLDHVVNGVTIVPLIVAVPVLGDAPDWMRRGMLIALAVVCAGGVLAWLFADPSASPDSHLLGRLRRGLGVARSPAIMTRAALISVAAWFAEVGVVWLSLRAFDDRFGVAMAVVTLISVNMALAIPSPPGNLGTLEVGAVLALMALGVPREEAAAFALAYHFLQLVSVWLLLPLGWLWTRRVTPSGPGNPLALRNAIE